jgi:muramoyltetrapeptide carboxypeptidase
MNPRLPPPVRPGDRIGVAALSGPVDPDRLDAGLAALLAMGFEVVTARNLRRRHDLFAGSDAERLAAFHELAADPGVRAIVFARGGHGLLRVLPEIDWGLLARHPRAYLGYSDLTPFLNGVVDRLGLVAFHGPMAATSIARGLEPDDLDSLLGALAGELPLEYPLAGFVGDGVESAEEIRAPLRGGCLTLLSTTVGTPWAVRLEGSILFVEDVAEPLYRIDRMLTHLRLSNSLTGIRGVVIGSMRGTDEAPERASSVPERVAGHVGDVPVAWGLPAGHGMPNRTLPLGAVARLDPASPRLLVEAPGSAR